MDGHEQGTGSPGGTGVAGRLDAFQRRHRWAGQPIAVVYKFVDDEGTYQAALLTYYGFVSLFPLLLLAVTVLGYVLAGDPAAQQAALQSALRNVPVLGDQIGANVRSLQGSAVALVVSIVVSLYGALGVTQALFTAMDRMWAVPVAERLSLPVAYGRGLAALAVLAVSLAATTALAGLSTAVGAMVSPWFDPVLRAVSVLAAVGVNVGLFLAGFTLLTSKRVTVAELWRGALVAAVTWQVLQLVGTYLVARQLRGMTASYGVFGIVLGLLAWIYLAALVVLLCVELNAVRALRLAPRSLFAVAPADTAMTAGDHRAYTAYARAERRKDFQHVDVRFEPDTPAEPLPIPEQRDGSTAPDPAPVAERGDGARRGGRP